MSPTLPQDELYKYVSATNIIFTQVWKTLQYHQHDP